MLTGVDREIERELEPDGVVHGDDLEGEVERALLPGLERAERAGLGLHALARVVGAHRLRRAAGVFTDGEEGGELYGLIRAHYEIPIYKGLGLGFSPLWVYRYGAYKEVENVRSDSFETKTYVMWKI